MIRTVAFRLFVHKDSQYKYIKSAAWNNENRSEVTVSGNQQVLSWLKTKLSCSSPCICEKSEYNLNVAT